MSTSSSALLVVRSEQQVPLECDGGDDDSLQCDSGRVECEDKRREKHEDEEKGRESSVKMSH